MQRRNLLTRYYVGGRPMPTVAWVVFCDAGGGYPWVPWGPLFHDGSVFVNIMLDLWFKYISWSFENLTFWSIYMKGYSPTVIKKMRFMSGYSWQYTTDNIIYPMLAYNLITDIDVTNCNGIYENSWTIYSNKRKSFQKWMYVCPNHNSCFYWTLT